MLEVSQARKGRSVSLVSKVCVKVILKKVQEKLQSHSCLISFKALLCRGGTHAEP